MKIPTSWQIDTAPLAESDVVPKLMACDYRVQVSPTTIILRRDFVLGSLAVEPARYTDLRNFYEKVVTRDHASVLFRTHPNPNHYSLLTTHYSLLTMIIAAIRSGTDPAAPLPPAAFHHWLEDPIYCPKCEATYMLVCPYDDAISRHFAEDSRRHLQMLRKAVMLGHSTDHRISHFETNGVVVTSHVTPKPGADTPPASLHALKPASKHIN